MLSCECHQLNYANLHEMCYKMTLVVVLYVVVVLFSWAWQWYCSALVHNLYDYSERPEVVNVSKIWEEKDKSQKK